MLHGQGHLVLDHVLLVLDLLLLVLDLLLLVPLVHGDVPLVHGDDPLVSLSSCPDHLSFQTLLLSILVKKLPAERVHLKTRQSVEMAPTV